MTDARMQLKALLEKTADADLLNEMIGFAANRLMELEADGLCNAGRHERSAERANHRNGYRDRAPSISRCRSSERAPILA